MKLTKIIGKNFKTLLRSKSSALVLIIGPLLLISLVGLAFNNTSSLNVNVGYYGPENNVLLDSYIAEIDTSSYTINRFPSIEQCIDNIKLSTIHACIEFPMDFEISNNKVNEIKFFIDQSKVNLVYSIVDTVSKSFSRASSNLSIEMTNDILSVVTQNRQGMIEAQAILDTTVEENNNLKKTSDGLQRDLNTIVIDTKEASKGTGNLDSYSEDLEDYIKAQRTQAFLINSYLNQLFDIVGTPTNQTLYDEISAIVNADDADGYTHTTKGKIFQAWNKSDAARKNLVNVSEGLTNSVTGMLDEIDDAKKAQTKVSQSLRDNVNKKLDLQNQEITTIKNNIGNLVLLIDNIAISDAENIVNPITTKIETISSEKSHLSFLFPSLIILLIMFISILISANLVLMEKNSKAYFRNFTTPTKDSTFILATYLTSILIVTFQLVIVLSIAAYAFNAPILQNLGLISLIMLLSTTLFIFIGMAIGYMFNNEETAMIGAISVSSLFMLLSDLILPLESMPKYLIEIAKFNPFLLGSETLRQVMLFNVSFDAIKIDIGILLGFSLIILTFMVMLQQFMKLLYLSNFSSNKVKINKKTNVRDYFKINNEPVVDIEGLIKVIRHMSDKDFKKHTSKNNNIIAKWIIEVLQNVDLGEKIKEKKKKEDIIFLLKRNSNQENERDLKDY